MNILQLVPACISSVLSLFLNIYLYIFIMDNTLDGINLSVYNC